MADRLGYADLTPGVRAALRRLHADPFVQRAVLLVYNDCPDLLHPMTRDLIDRARQGAPTP